MESVVSSRGQITIPVKVRRTLGWKPGTAIEFTLQSGGVLLRKGQPQTRGVDRVYGLLRDLPPTGALMRELRGPAPRRRRPR